MSGGATAYSSRPTLARGNEELYPGRKYSAASIVSSNSGMRGRHTAVSSPLLSPSNRSSSTYHSNCSNRSSTTIPGTEYHSPRRRGTPSSECGSSKKSTDIRASSRDVYGAHSLIKSPQVTQSAVDLIQAPPKKKGFSLFSLFRRNKKKPAEVIAVDTTLEGEKVRTPAEIKAEEMRILHEEEFSKLRRQREKDKSRTIYDMLPQNRQSSSPRSIASSSPSTAYLSPVATPRIRSASSSNVGHPSPRPTTNYYVPSVYLHNNHPASRSSTHFSPQGGYPDPRSQAHRSAEAVNTIHHRSLAKSPLIPPQIYPHPPQHHDPSRRSFYVSDSHPKHCHPQSYYHPQRTSRAWE